MSSIRHFFTRAIKRVVPQVDGRSLQFRLTVGVTVVAVCGVGSIAAWTAWKTQQLLINSHKQLTSEVLRRLPQDVKLYTEMMSVEMAIQRAIDNRTLEGMLVVLDRPEGVMIPEGADDFLQAQAAQLVAQGGELRGLDVSIQRVGDRALVLCRGPLTVDGRTWGILYVAQDITQEQAMFGSILQSLSMASLIIIAVMAYVLAQYVRRSLQPLKQVGQLTRHVNPETMGPLKLHLDAAPTEVNDLTDTWDDLLQRLAAAWEQQRRFVNDVSHELRTPLTLVSGYLQSTLRRSTTLTEPQREALEIAAAEANRTIQLLETLLELARADAGTMHYHREPIPLYALGQELEDQVLQGRDRLLKLDIDPDLMVEGDRQRLTQVLMHLIDNAMTYSEPDQPVILRGRSHHPQAQIDVQDFGCGIALNHQPRIFDRFYRVDESRGRATGGCGLGLALVKTLVTGMGGQVSVISRPNDGSTFTITLPLASSMP
jgi:signal transduction histidine kinase